MPFTPKVCQVENSRVLNLAIPKGPFTPFQMSPPTSRQYTMGGFSYPDPVTKVMDGFYNYLRMGSKESLLSNYVEGGFGSDGGINLAGLWAGWLSTTPLPGSDFVFDCYTVNPRNVGQGFNYGPALPVLAFTADYNGLFDTTGKPGNLGNGCGPSRLGANTFAWMRCGAGTDIVKYMECDLATNSFYDAFELEAGETFANNWFSQLYDGTKFYVCYNFFTPAPDGVVLIDFIPQAVGDPLVYNKFALNFTDDYVSNLIADYNTGGFIFQPWHYSTDSFWGLLPDTTKPGGYVILEIYKDGSKCRVWEFAGKDDVLAMININEPRMFKDNYAADVGMVTGVIYSGDPNYNQGTYFLGPVNSSNPPATPIQKLGCTNYCLPMHGVKK